MEFVARSKVQGVLFATTRFLRQLFFCHSVIVLVGQATKEWETRSVWCDGVFFATVCFLRRRIFCEGVCFSDAVFVAHIWSCILQRVRVLLASVAGCFFCDTVFLRRSVGVFCVDQKCFLHSESVFFASQRVFCDREQGL